MINIKKEEIKLTKGQVLIYDFGSIKLYNYNTNDYLIDQVLMVEKNKKMVIIESPTFYDNDKELEEYIKSLNTKVEGILLAYHMSGANFLKGVKKYATQKADDYGHNGGGKVLIDSFTTAFGTTIFDNNVHSVTDYLKEGEVNIADIKFNIIPTADAFDIEIPKINVLYTHMLGSDVHSILGSVDHANVLIKSLESYIVKNYNLILTSHYIPEDITAVKTKIAYLNNLLTIAKNSQTKEEFIFKIKEKYPNYSDENYLEMTANNLFNN